MLTLRNFAIFRKLVVETDVVADEESSPKAFEKTRSSCGLASWPGCFGLDLLCWIVRVGYRSIAWRPLGYAFAIRLQMQLFCVNCLPCRTSGQRNQVDARGGSYFRLWSIDGALLSAFPRPCTNTDS